MSGLLNIEALHYSLVLDEARRDAEEIRLSNPIHDKHYFAPQTLAKQKTMS